MTQGPHRVIIRPEAEVDISDAAVWYENQQPGLGEDFLSQIELAIAGAAENPLSLSVPPPKAGGSTGADQTISVSRVLHSPRRRHHRLSRAARRAAQP